MQSTDSTIKFKKFGNYLVGKNNIGKTSTLELIRILLSGRNFSDTDFFDTNKPIEILMTILLNDSEIGVFGDNFSESEENQLDLKYIQDDPDSQITITVASTDEIITRNQIKNSNLISFSSNRNPVKDNDLIQQNGSYKFIPFLVKKYIELNKSSISDSPEQSDYDKNLINYINQIIKKLKPFRDNNVTLGLDSNYLDYIIRALSLKGPSGIKFSSLGSGTQFSSLIPIVIIDQIINWSRYNHLDDHLCTNIQDNTKKELNIVLCLDEPEVHLHPNLQLSMREDLERLLGGQDEQFNDLLKILFNIDKIYGQLIIVMHSPYILSDDYHEYIRFGTINDGLSITSGSDLKLSSKEIKQLEMQLPYIKSSLFSDGVILVEGVTESGAFTIFSQRMNISLSQRNINIVDANGVQSIPSLLQLFQTLNIKNIAIIDNDNTDRKYVRTLVTDELDFEYECFKGFKLKDINHYLRDFEFYINDNEYNGAFWDNYLDPTFKTERITLMQQRKEDKDFVNLIDSTIEKLDDSDKARIIKTLKDKLIKSYLKNKSVINGRIIAKNITSIPTVYQDVLRGILENE